MSCDSQCSEALLLAALGWSAHFLGLAEIFFQQGLHFEAYISEILLLKNV